MTCLSLLTLERTFSNLGDGSVDADWLMARLILTCDEHSWIFPWRSISVVVTFSGVSGLLLGVSGLLL